MNRFRLKSRLSTSISRACRCVRLRSESVVDLQWIDLRITGASVGVVSAAVIEDDGSAVIARGISRAASAGFPIMR